MEVNTKVVDVMFRKTLATIAQGARTALVAGGMREVAVHGDESFQAVDVWKLSV
jgi:hypothetical protein